MRDPSRRGTRFDVVVNMAILVTCGVMTAAVIQRWSVAPGDPGHEARDVGRISVGDAGEQLPGVSYSDAPLSLVLYLRSSCHYCTESMPFYRTLTEAPHRGRVKFVAVSAEDEEVTRTYLDHYGVVVDRVASYRGRVRATPTLVAVDSAGIVNHVWIGKQPAQGQQEILKAVQQR